MGNTRFYDDQSFGAVQQQQMPGNDLATLLFTPQAGTGAETKVHTTTLGAWFPQRNIILKKIGYIVETAQTGTGMQSCSGSLRWYNLKSISCSNGNGSERFSRIVSRLR